MIFPTTKSSRFPMMCSVVCQASDDCKYIICNDLTHFAIVGSNIFKILLFSTHGCTKRGGGELMPPPPIRFLSNFLKRWFNLRSWNFQWLFIHLLLKFWYVNCVCIFGRCHGNRKCSCRFSKKSTFLTYFIVEFYFPIFFMKLQKFPTLYIS